MARGGFSVVISATDSATGTIDKINRKLAEMRKPVDALKASNAKLAQSLGQLGANTGVTPALQTITRGIQGVGRSAEIAAAGLSRMAPALGAVTGAASVAGVAALVSHFGALSAARDASPAGRPGLVAAQHADVAGWGHQRARDSSPVAAPATRRRRISVAGEFCGPAGRSRSAERDCRRRVGRNL